MADALTVAVVQLTSTRDVDANLAATCAFVREAARAGADLIATPENYAFLGADKDKLPFAQGVEDGGFLAPLRALARELGVAVLAGSIPERGPDAEHVFNTSVLIGRRGEALAAYRKIHLFDVELADGTSLLESGSVAPGRDVVVADFEGWRVGLSVCYDLRFPELYRKLAGAGADIVCVPAAFTLHTGKDHWEILLRARAIENQCYVVAPGQFGRHAERRQSWGKSMVVDPWGTPLCVAPERPGVVLATLRRSDIDSARRQLPCLRHRVL